MEAKSDRLAFQESVRISDGSAAYSVRPGSVTPGLVNEESEDLQGGWDSKAEDDFDAASFPGKTQESERLIDADEISKDGVVTEYEVALKHLGFGFFHVLLMVINGFAFSADAVEVLSISFIFPVLADRDQWHVTNEQEAILGSIIFVGMLFGSFIWGSLADMVGRRTTIIVSLFFSVVFGFSSAFIPWYWVFVLFRFFSGFGVAGSLPVIVPYTSEFIRNKFRGPYLGVQAMFWTAGRVLCAALAWAIIPRETFRFGSDDVISWRVFIAVAALPTFLGAVVYIFLPESPRFLLEIGKEKKALQALRTAHMLNHFYRRGKKHEYPVKKICLKEVKRDNVGSKLRDLQFQAAGARITEILKKGLNLFQRKYLRQTLLLLVIMFCLSFGSYGVTLWYPTYVDQIAKKSNQDNLNRVCNETMILSVPEIRSVCDCSSTSFEDAVISNMELKNWQINDVLLNNITFSNVSFEDVLFNNTNFDSCKFQNCTFESLHFQDVFFDSMTLENVSIELGSSCLFSNSSSGEISLTDVSMNGSELAPGTISASQLQAYLDEFSLKEKCLGPEFDVICRSDDFRIYRDSFFVSASALPGNLASAIAVYLMWRNVWLAIAMFVSTASVFLLYIDSSEVFVIAMLCIFTAVSTPAWNDTSLIMAEVYPTNLRTTATGTHLLMARIGAILGTNIFGLFVRVDPTIPILTVACLFFVGSVASLGLPKTTRKTLLK